MWPKIIIFSLIFTTVHLSAFGQDQTIDCNFENVSFNEFAKVIFEKSGVRIFYSDNWVDDITVTLQINDITAIKAVEMVVRDHGLTVSYWNSNIVLIPGEVLIKKLPEFETPVDDAEILMEKQDSITKSEERYLRGRRADVPESYTIGKRNMATGKQKVKVRGRILDKQTGESLIGATVYIEEKRLGVITDQNGYFTLVISPGIYDSRIESIGYERKKSQFEILSGGSFVIDLERSLIPLEEVVIMGDRQKSNLTRDPGVQNISISSIKEIPMMMGERDLLKLTELLPGIVSVGEGSAGINVRGGNSDQNAFYINKVPIYNTSHLFGFFPAFNSDIIRDFNVYKGYVPARYGGRLSSVFNMVTKMGNRKNFSARGSVNPISANLTVEGPLVKDAASFLLSGRSSYSDWILSQINDYDISHSSAQFNDLSATLNYEFKKNQISLFAYRSYDRFRLSDLNEYKYSNEGYSLNYRRNFTPGLTMDLALISSSYAFSTIDMQQESSSYIHDYKINHYELRNDFKLVLNSQHSLEYGIDAIVYQLNKGKVLPYGDASLRNIVELGNEKGIEGALYISDNYDITPKINLNAGIRYVTYSALGPNEVYTYSPGQEKDIRYISDTLYYGNNKAIKWYSAPEIRAAINFETGSNSSVKLAFNQMHQNLFMLNTTISVAPNTQWQLANYHLSPSSSNQISAGYFRNWNRGVWESSLEVFAKNTGHYTEFKDGAEFLSNPLVETNVLQGNQKAYGIEFYLERRHRKLGGWISYTWSRSLVTVDGEESWNSINNGETYPSNFDIPHSLNAVVNYHFTRRLILSSIITYQSGRPVTYPVSVYYIDKVPYTDFSKRNEYRIPFYFRSDLSLALEGNLKKDKLLHSTLLLNVYNITGRNNPYSVFFRSEDRRIKSYKYSVIGVPFFTVTWMFKFGNYATE